MLETPAQDRQTDTCRDPNPSSSPHPLNFPGSTPDSPKPSFAPKPTPGLCVCVCWGRGRRPTRLHLQAEGFLHVALQQTFTEDLCRLAWHRSKHRGQSEQLFTFSRGMGARGLYPGWWGEWTERPLFTLCSSPTSQTMFLAVKSRWSSKPDQRLRGENRAPALSW